MNLDLTQEEYDLIIGMRFHDESKAAHKAITEQAIHLYAQGVTLAEIAKQLGMNSRQAVWSRISNAKRITNALKYKKNLEKR